MTYASGTFSATQPTLDSFRAVLDAALTAAGWEVLGNFSDPDYPPESYSWANKYYRVWRNPKANSGEQTDLYLTQWFDGGNENSTGDIYTYLTVSHDFDSTTRKVTKGVNPDYTTFSTAEGYAQRNPQAQAPRSWYGVSVRPFAGGQYWISATKKRLIVATRDSSGAPFHGYWGFFDNFMPASVPNSDTPVWQGGLYNFGYGRGYNGAGFTREPGLRVTAENNQNGAFGFRLSPQLVDTPAYDHVYTQGYLAYPALLWRTRDYSNYATGLLYDVVVTSDQQNRKGQAFVQGDTLTVGSKTYVCVGTQNSVTSPSYFVDTAA